MITLDRRSGVPLVDQLVHQLRFQIAAGRYQVGDGLPSTRGLATSLGVSFHTVRKAYQSMVEVGLLESRAGRGFFVKAFATESTSERFEKGASIAAEALQRLISLGLKEHEIEALLFEQFEQQQEVVSDPAIIFAAPYRELGDRCAQLVESAINLPVESVPIRDLESNPGAEYVITPFPKLRQVLRSLPDAHAIGVTVFYAERAQQALARLSERDTVGIAVEDALSVEPIMIDIRQQTGFSGQVFGISASADVEEFTSVLSDVDLLLYTHQSRRKVQSRIGAHPSVELDPRIAEESMHTIKETFSLR